MLCDVCGFSNLDDANFCCMCGAELQRVAESDLDIGTNPCPWCGFLNEAHAFHCRSCGKKMKRKKTRSKADKKNNQPAEAPPADDVFDAGSLLTPEEEEMLLSTEPLPIIAEVEATTAAPEEPIDVPEAGVRADAVSPLDGDPTAAEDAAEEGDEDLDALTRELEELGPLDEAGTASDDLPVVSASDSGSQGSLPEGLELTEENVSSDPADEGAKPDASTEGAAQPQGEAIAEPEGNDIKPDVPAPGGGFVADPSAAASLSDIETIKAQIAMEAPSAPDYAPNPSAAASPSDIETIKAQIAMEAPSAPDYAPNPSAAASSDDIETIKAQIAMDAPPAPEYVPPPPASKKSAAEEELDVDALIKKVNDEQKAEPLKSSEPTLEELVNKINAESSENVSEKSPETAMGADTDFDPEIDAVRVANQVVGTQIDDDAGAEPVVSRHLSDTAGLGEMKEFVEEESPPEEVADEAPEAIEESAAEEPHPLSSTLEAMIGDLLEAEIHETSESDSVPPDEKGFPPKDPEFYSRKRKRKSRYRWASLISAFMIMLFLTGINLGLAFSYILH